MLDFLEDIESINKIQTPDDIIVHAYKAALSENTKLTQDNIDLKASAEDSKACLERLNSSFNSVVEKLERKENELKELREDLDYETRRGNCYDILVDDIKNNKALTPVEFKTMVFKLLKNSKPGD